MLQLERGFPRRKSDIKRRTALVVWLVMGSSLLSLTFTYVFYMRYQEHELLQLSQGDRAAVGALVRSSGYSCSQVCAIDRPGAGNETTVTCGTTAGINACTTTVQFVVSIARASHRP